MSSLTLMHDFSENQTELYMVRDFRAVRVLSHVNILLYVCACDHLIQVRLSTMCKSLTYLLLSQTEVKLSEGVG